MYAWFVIVAHAAQIFETTAETGITICKVLFHLPCAARRVKICEPVKGRSCASIRKNNDPIIMRDESLRIQEMTTLGDTRNIDNLVHLQLHY